jgi:hypothetical protein
MVIRKKRRSCALAMVRSVMASPKEDAEHSPRHNPDTGKHKKAAEDGDKLKQEPENPSHGSHGLRMA